MSLCSVRGSPGVTSWSLLLAAAWPAEYVVERVVLEADCDGGVLGARYGFSKRASRRRRSALTAQGATSPNPPPLDRIRHRIKRGQENRESEGRCRDFDRQRSFKYTSAKVWSRRFLSRATNRRAPMPLVAATAPATPFPNPPLFGRLRRCGGSGMAIGGEVGTGATAAKNR